MLDSYEFDFANPDNAWTALGEALGGGNDYWRQHPPRADDAGSPLLEWGRRYLPAHFSRPASAMHRWLGEALDRMGGERGMKVNLLGPRGGAKSTVATLAFALRAAVENREPYIWIVSDTRPQAHAHLENLKAELLDNRLLAADYPSAVGRGAVWRAGAIVLRNGVAVDAFGTGQRIRGRRWRESRPSLIVCDDLQNDQHMQSARQRERSRTWFHGALLKAGTPETNLVNLATALHQQALALELGRTPGWLSRTFRSIVSWPVNQTLWEEWEAIYSNPEDAAARGAARAFYEVHRAAMDAGAAVLWPEYENIYTLMAMRAESGRWAFEREKQNSPINPDLCEWPEDCFGEKIWFEAWPRRLRAKVLALDPSKGADAGRGDYSAFVRLGVDEQGILHVEADLARRPTTQIVADGVEHVRQFQPDIFAVEANQFQDLLGEQFQSEFRRQGMLAVRPYPLQNQVNKTVRIRRLGPYLAGQLLRFKVQSPGTRMLVEQLKQFPIGDHDDGPDALEMAIRVAAELMRTPMLDGLGNRLPLELGG